MRPSLPKAFLALSLLLAACAEESPTKPTQSPKRQAQADAIALCDRWSEAAKRGRVESALACFDRGPDFSYSLDGKLLDNFDDFAKLTRRSYKERKRLILRRAKRDVILLSPTAVLVTGLDNFEITTKDDQTLTGSYAYGIVCRRRDGDWRIVHAYEIRRR